MQIIWFKRDLRIQDHAPLRAALQAVKTDGPVLCLYIHEPSLVARADCARQHTEFALECLNELDQELRAMGTQLVQLVGEAVDVLDQLHKALHKQPSSALTSLNSLSPFTRILAHEETTTMAGYERDRAVKDWAKGCGVQFHEFAQNAVERGSRLEKDGHDFSAHMNRALAGSVLVSLPGIEDLVGVMGFGNAWAPTCLIQSAPRDAFPCGQGNDKPGRLKGGRAAAMAQLERFGDLDKLIAYPGAISSPNTAAEGCSRLSPYLSLGVVSDREVLRHLQTVGMRAKSWSNQGAVRAVEAGMKFFAQRMFWRAGYLQLMELNPQIELHAEVDGLVNARQPASGHDDYAAHHRFQLWAEGRTGVPMIDGAMRLLNATGWANFRLRGAVCSFALNELWLAQHKVALHLARQFLDFEPAIHYSQLAIHGGLLKGSRPLVYSAIKQARDHDPQGEFVRKWVPELAQVPLEHIFEPWGMNELEQERAGCRIGVGVGVGVDYPAPIVDVKAANACAKARVYAVWQGEADPGGLPHLARSPVAKESVEANVGDTTANEARKTKSLKDAAKAAGPAKSQLSLF